LKKGQKWGGRRCRVWEAHPKYTWEESRVGKRDSNLGGTRSCRDKTTEWGLGPAFREGRKRHLKGEKRPGRGAGGKPIRKDQGASKFGERGTGTKERPAPSALGNKALGKDPKKELDVQRH